MNRNCRFGRGSTALWRCHVLLRNRHVPARICCLQLRQQTCTLCTSKPGWAYAGHAQGGPNPTIIVSLQNMRFRFFFLSYLLGSSVRMPAMTTTITAEDLCSGGGKRVLRIMIDMESCVMAIFLLGGNSAAETRSTIETGLLATIPDLDRGTKLR